MAAVEFVSEGEVNEIADLSEVFVILDWNCGGHHRGLGLWKGIEGEWVDWLGGFAEATLD